MPSPEDAPCEPLEADCSLPACSPSQSCRDSDATSLRPPSSLLIERDLSPPSLSERNVNAQDEREMPASSPNSPAQGASEPAAMLPSFGHPQPACSSFATTLDYEGTCDLLGHETRELRDPDKPINVSEHHFDSPRPEGDPAVLELPPFDYQYPPHSRDEFPDSDKALFERMDTSKSLPVETLLERYSDEGARLIDFLAGQEQSREESYAPVSEARTHADSVLARFLRENRQKSAAARRSRRLSGGRLRPPSPPPLTPAQQEVMRNLETDLVYRMEDVSINHAESEGVIAGVFTYKWDGAEQRPPEHVRQVLYESGGLDKRLFRTRLIADPAVGEESWLDGFRKPEEKSQYQEPLDNIWDATRATYNKVFRAQWQPEPPPPRIPAIEYETQRNPLLEVKGHSTGPPPGVIPEWFPIFMSYEILGPGRGSQASQFKQLLNIIHHLEWLCKHASTQPPKWEKEWHEPSSMWDTPVRRRSGG
ncbi:hypothetical protein AK830_g10142 [Neonectria ditissima]|uniref:Uncharacterized protein n=1 Tax=Neonectria ditissima TaxID=78410 RepID=A0A0N8H5K3_9HYPO|nr:hypothetical protein AK830_g10142 [Neonectria ditissima]